MTPLTILIDEFSNVAYPGFIDALNKGGGAKANIMLAMQSLADPEASMGKDGTQRVMDNLNTRIWFRLTDDTTTAKLAVEGLGMTSVGREEISPQPELRGQQRHVGRLQGCDAVRGQITGAPGMGDGPAARRGVRAHAGRELEAAGAAAPAGQQERRARKWQPSTGLAEVLTGFKEQARQVDGERREGTLTDRSEPGVEEGNPDKGFQSQGESDSAATAKDKGVGELADSWNGSQP